MQHRAKRVIAKALACAMALSLAGAGVSEADAAKKPKLSKKSISVAVKKSKKVTIKNVKAKKVKKLTVKSKNKKIAAVKKKGKTAFTVTGKKKGNTKVTVKVKVGKKTTSLTLKVKVTKATDSTKDKTPAPTAGTSTGPSATAKATAPAANVPTPVPTPAGPVKPTMRPPLEQTAQETRPVADPLLSYENNFDDGEMGLWYGRYAEDAFTKAVITDEAHSGKALRLQDRRGADEKYHSWYSLALDMSGVGTLGGSYKISFWAKVPDSFSKDLDGDEVPLRFSGAYKITSDSKEEYCNYPADTDYPISADEWRKYEVEFTAPSTFFSYIIYFETQGSGSAQFDFIIDDVVLTRTAAPAGPDLTLDSLKDTYAPFIGTFGTALTFSDLADENTLKFIKHHYNSVTLGNAMKVDALVSSKNVLKQSEANYILSDAYSTFAENKDAEGNVIVPEFSLDEVDKVMKICKDNGLKLRVHSPMWHQQMPKYFFCEQYDEDKPVIKNKEVILAREEMYIRNIYQYFLTSPYADVISSWDVVNEYTHMHNISAQAGSDNWWRYSFGEEMKTDCEYVKKAFVWADEVLTLCDRQDISLIYNDYNTYEPKITNQIIELINNINKVDDINKVGKICDGVGMQSHMNDTNATSENYAAALAKFTEAGFEIQITELDITCTGTVTGETSAEDKQMVYEENAAAYSQVMKAILDAKKNGANITSVTIWGLTDATSWRSEKAPLLFGTDISDKKPSFDAVINAAKNYGK